LNIKTAIRWIQIADRDFDIANLLPDDFSDGSAYHYQQAAEKYLKGFLAAHQAPLKKSHNISTLVLDATLIDPEFALLAKEIDLDVMTSFATFYRYPNDQEEQFPLPEDLVRAKSFCEKVRGMVEAKIIEVDDSKDGCKTRKRGDGEF